MCIQLKKRLQIKVSLTSAVATVVVVVVEKSLKSFTQRLATST